MQISDEEYIYKLVGVNIHRGTAEHGHYFSLINTKRGHEEADESKPEWKQVEKDNWKEFNDEEVKYLLFSEIKKEAFGGNSNSSGEDNDMNVFLMQSGNGQSYGQSAYMLVYEKMKKNPIYEVVKEGLKTDHEVSESQAPDATLECANTAESRDAYEIVK